MSTELTLAVVSAAELARRLPKPPKFPKVVKNRRGEFLVLADGRDYQIPESPVKTLGLLHHLSQKRGCDARFLGLAIERIAAARDWPIHPF